MPNEPVTFVAFTGDLVTFALKKILQVDWKFPHQKSPHLKTFSEIVGEAALVFRDRHADEFAERIDEFPLSIAEDVESAVDYLEHFVGTHFKGRVPLMELIVYCAFLVDLCVYCADNGSTDLVDDIVSESYDVYDDHVRPYFDTVGGWSALRRMARVYLDFVESMRVYSDLVATGNENGIAIPRDQAKHAIHIKNFRGIEFKDVNPIACTGSESEGATSSTAAANNIISLKTKDGQTIPKNVSLDRGYIRAIDVETSSIDSEDLMSISSTETDDKGICSAIAGAGSIDVHETNTSTQYKQDIFNETASSYSESSSSICCLVNKFKGGNSSAGTGYFQTYSNGTRDIISSAASNNTSENIDDVHVEINTNSKRDNSISKTIASAVSNGILKFSDEYPKF